MNKNNNLKIKFITINEIIKIHDDIIDEFGGEKGILIKSNLEFIIEFIRVQYYNIKLDDILKLALLLSGILLLDIHLLMEIKEPAWKLLIYF